MNLQNLSRADPDALDDGVRVAGGDRADPFGVDPDDVLSGVNRRVHLHVRHIALSLVAEVGRDVTTGRPTGIDPTDLHP